MLMTMRRWNVVLVLVVAALLAVQPVLHNHSAIPDGPSASSACATCSVSAGAPLPDAPQVAASVPVAVASVTSEPAVPATERVSSLPSRAPPAAA